MTGPWTFDEAVARCAKASERQSAVEDELRRAYIDAAEADENYRVALAREIITQHDAGVAWSAASDLARGNQLVAALRRKRDVAEGVREAMTQAAWRRAADRKDAQRFSDWSQRRELAEHGGPDPRLAFTEQAA